uniref:Uncharacterized protein n=1 Tax=viral metagenome TaxID=1070528 RepID=A0A6H1ZZ49_9ZZZZ
MKKTTFAILAGLLIGGLLSWGVASLAQSGFWYPVSNNLKPIINSYGLRIPSLASCDTVDTDASGIFSCGADAGGVYDPVIIQDGGILYATNTASTFGIGITAPSYTLSLQTASTSGYFGIGGTAEGDVFAIDSSGIIATGTWQGTPIADTFVADNITLTNITQITTRNLSDLTDNISNATTGTALSVFAGAVTDAQVPDTITLTNITQITNRAISDLTGTLAFASTTGTVDISDRTNLTAGTLITLNGDTLNVTDDLAQFSNATSGFLTSYAETDPLASASSTDYVQRNEWTTINNYPTGCTNQFVYAIGDTLSCSAATNAYVDDDITLTNITQITNRAITDLTGTLPFASTTGTVGVTRGGTGLTSFNLGDIIYASTANTLSALATGTEGQVLEIVSGVPAWGTDDTGDGADTDWIQSADLLYSTTTANTVLIGGTATTSAGYVFEVIGSSLLDAATFSGTITGNLTGNVTGNADTATALAADPTDCASGNAAISIDASGNLTCATFYDALSDMTLAAGNIYMGDASNNPIATSSLYIDTNGNVGIGTTTPAYTLDIEGQLHVQATTTMSSSLIVDDGIAATTTVTIGDNTGNYGFCLKVHNSFATGTWLYYTNLDVAGTWGTTSASACGD